VARKLEAPRRVAFPLEKAKADSWAAERRGTLKAIVRLPGYHEMTAKSGKPSTAGGTTATPHTIQADSFSIPVVELTRGEPKGTVVVLSDTGRAGALAQVEEQLKAGNRVLAADVYYFGEMHPYSHDWLWTLMLATVGDRALGHQAAQLNAVSRWAGEKFGAKGGVKVVAVGPRTSTIAMVAAALDTKSIAALELHDPLGSLKEVIEENRAVAKTPELFCFGLLEQFDTPHLAALVAPRPVVVKTPSERVKKEWTGLKTWYSILGQDFDPLK
jgi:hypothetical protein